MITLVTRDSERFIPSGDIHEIIIGGVRFSPEAILNLAPEDGSWSRWRRMRRVGDVLEVEQAGPNAEIVDFSKNWRIQEA